MSVNHFLYSDEKLIDEYEEIIEIYINYTGNKPNDYYEIRKEILERMKK